jgi:formiminotetrahydrofolate cyclodeaminase
MGAYYNVKINAPSVEDKVFVQNMLDECSKLLAEKDKLFSEISQKVETSL